MSKYLFILILAYSGCSLSQFEQLGSDIYAPDFYERIGSRNDISQDGKTIASVSIIWGDCAIETSSAKIYCWQENDWTPKGEFIYGQNEWERIFEVKLAENGNRVALGMLIKGEANEEDDYLARVFDWNNGIWEQTGNDILIGNNGDNFDAVASLPVTLDFSENGDNLIVGCHDNSEAGSSNGKVAVLYFNGNNWINKGVPFYGQNLWSGIGNSVCISDDGNVIAFSRSGGDHEVFIYRWDGTDWLSMGNPITSSLSSSFGYAIDLSSGGETIAIGSPSEQLTYYSDPYKQEGSVRIYTWTGVKWAQTGQTIYGDEFYSRLGAAVSLSDDGLTVAIGEKHQKDQPRGKITVWDLSDTLWLKRTDEIGDNQNYELLYHVSISGSGDYLVASSPSYSTYAAYGDGRVRVFSYSGAFPIDVPIYETTDTASVYIAPVTELTVFPNPSNDFINISFDNNEELYSVSIFNYNGGLVLQTPVVNDSNFRLSISELVPGKYLLVLTSETSTKKQTIVVN